MNSDTAASRAMPRRTTANAASITPTASLAAILLSILVLVAPSAHAQTENSPPTAIGQSVSTPEDTPRAIVLTGSDPDNDPLTFSIAAAPGNGTLSGTPPNVTYTPVKDFNGTDRFFFTVSDGQVSSIPAQVEITVIPVNDPPTAVPDTLTVEEDTTINNPGNRVNVLLNDNDPDGDTLSVTSASASNGTTSILSNGNVAYSPRANYFGSDTISYTISDGKGGTAGSTVAVTVQGVPDAPVANNDTATVDEDSSNNVINVTANDTDADGDNLTVSAASASNGTAAPDGGNVRYTPAANFSGPVTINYTINDGTGRTASATVSVTVRSVNDPPVANNDTATVAEDSSNNVISVTANDTDADGDDLTVTSASAADGTVTRDGGNVRYTPPPDFNGSTTINYTISDGNGGSDSATVSVTVTQQNDPPVANNDTATVAEDSSNNVINVTANDTDPDDDTLTVTSASAQNGSVTFGGGNVTYTPNANFSGTDRINYTISDGSGGSDSAVVTVTVTAVNDPPVANDDTATVAEDSTNNVINVTANDTDADGDTLTVTGASPQNGAVTIDGGVLIYTPSANFSGTDRINYTISDGNGGSDSAVVTVTVTGESDAPRVVAPAIERSTSAERTAVEGSNFVFSMAESFTDDDGDPLTYTATGLPGSGGITIDPVSGVISGTPTIDDARDNDPYLVTVTAEDPSGLWASDSFDLTVSALNRANIGLTITVTPESALPGEQLQWSFVVENPVGPQPGENVELTGRFVGEGLSVAAGGGSGCSINLQTGEANFRCTVGALPVGDTVSVNFSTTASQASEVLAFGTAAGAQEAPIDPNTADNSAVRAVGVAESFSDGAVQFLGSGTIRSIASGDFDGDGTGDLIVGTAAGQVEVYLGDDPRESCGCQRDFVPTPISISGTGSIYGIAVADFDNDGDLDFVIANNGGENNGGQPDTVYVNDGTGNFSLAAVLEPSNARDVAVGDFNNDGNPDIAVAAGGPNLVYFGDGSGDFSAAIALGNENSGGVAVGRFNGDNRDDLVFANIGTESRIWTATAGGGFAEVILPTASVGDAASVAAADLDNNGLDDLVFGRVALGMGDIPSNPVLLNQGEATFERIAELGISPTLDVLVGDVSEDGQLDIVFINASGLHQRWTGSGGEFTLHSEQIIDIGAVAGVLADLGFADSGDPGGPDLALGGAPDAGASVYLNDSAGNLGFGDAVPPVISLSGEATVNVPAGEGYSDAGATAVDNIDGNVSASIVVNNPVNTAVTGSYTVTYNVSDSAGNDAVQVTRTVNITAATGRGGGGGGSFGYWTLALLAAAQLLMLLWTCRKTRRTRISTV
jgi:hypothetical protein